MMATRYEHLGPFSDLVGAAAQARPLFRPAATVAETRRRAREVLRFSFGEERPIEPRVERRWQADGVSGEEVSWSVGFGPRTHAFLLRPAGVDKPLPGIVAMHDHANFKYRGKEKIAEGPDREIAAVADLRATYYGGRAYANELARRGFAVLAHDVFLWGSRRFPIETMPDAERALAGAVAETLRLNPESPEIGRYHAAAYLHENLIEKYCTLLGTSLAAVIAYEDGVALNYLRSRSDVDASRVGAIGFSGGGLRAAILAALIEVPLPRVVIGMMSTYETMLDRGVAPHTWMLFPPGWSAHGDLPDLAAAAAPAPLLVQYALDDTLFTPAGMNAADAHIVERYESVGAPAGYRSEFYGGPHRFDVEMQEAAFSWLAASLPG
jgi:dienelactone hydrolase